MESGSDELVFFKSELLQIYISKIATTKKQEMAKALQKLLVAKYPINIPKSGT